MVGMIRGETLLAIAGELTVNGLVLRYWLDQPDHGWRLRGSVHDLLVWPASARDGPRGR